METKENLHKFASFVWQKNQLFNLVGYADYETLYREAVDDSVFTMETSSLFVPSPEKILDIGTGAGFPGIIACMMFPDSEVTLIESSEKKACFLKEASEYLGLGNCRVICRRIEEFREKESFDLAFCKAVASLRVSLEYAVPFLKTGGIFIAHKGEKAETEIRDSENALKILNAEILRIICSGTRKYPVVRKKAVTAGKYPRKTGVPATRPL